MHAVFCTFVTTLEMIESRVDSCFAPFCMNDGISILIPMSFKTSPASLNPLSTTNTSFSFIQVLSSSVLQWIICLRMLASLFVESDKYGPRMETIYPVVVTTIIGFNSGLCLCRLYDLLAKEKLKLLYVHILSTQDQYSWIFCNTRGHEVFGKLTCVPLNYILPGFRLESHKWYKISHKSGRF